MIITLRVNRNFWFLVLCCLLVGVAMADGDGAVDSDTDSDTSSDGNSDDYFQLEQCISPGWIRHTYIVDDRTIIFYMNQQKIFVNRLPHRCAGLRSAGTFSYRLRGTQLCNVDMIKVVRSTGGRLDTGPTCGLGMFRPVTEEEAEMIRQKEVEIPPQESESAENSDASDSD
jgi:hypothetical protein